MKKLQKTEKKAFQVNSKHIEIVHKRKEEVARRLDRNWAIEQEGPILRGGNIHYEVAEKTRAVGCGGLGLMQQLVKKLGVAQAIDERVEVLKRHQPYYESDHVLNLIYNVASGGLCLQDVEHRRQDGSYLEALGADKIPAPSTEGDFLRRFSAEDVEDLMEAFNAARLKVWKQQGESFLERADIDVDGTVAPTWGECKQGMGLSYQGEWGYGPLILSLANSNEVLYTVNRSANRPSHEGAAEWLDRSVELVRRGGFRAVRLRGDTDFSLTRHFDRWTEDGVEFVFGMDAHPSFVKRAQSLDQERWTELVRVPRQKAQSEARQRPSNVKEQIVREREYKNLSLAKEEVAEWEYRPVRAQKSYRMIALRKTIQVHKGQQRLFDEVRYHFYVTNVASEELNTPEVVFENNGRCNQENVIEQLKNGVQALRMPSDTLLSNWAYLVIAAQAWNLKAWLGLVLPPELGARKLIRMEFRRFLQQVIQFPCQILRTGRRLVFRLLNVNGWSRLLLEGSLWLRHHRFG